MQPTVAQEPRIAQLVNAEALELAQRELPWEQLDGARVLITGAGGFLGNYLVRTLLALNSAGRLPRPLTVVAMVRDPERARQRFADLRQRPDFRLVCGDLSAVAVPDIGDADFVLHAASQASPRYYGSDPVGTLLPNAVGTAALLEALRRRGRARGLLFVSSSEVYGSAASDAPLQETQYGTLDPAGVRACYAESKRLGETLCVAWHHQHGLPTWIVRPFHTYGPGLLPNDGRVFADFVFNVARGENIVMNSDGLARRAFCYASDAIAGFCTVMLQGAPATPYNVANPQGELSVAELAELLVGLRPQQGLRVERRVRDAGASYLASPFSRLVPDVSRLAALGWAPRVAPAEGFRRTLEACL